MLARILGLMSRLLPSDFRERVFTPAFADYLLDADDGRPPRSLDPERALAALVLWIETLRLVLPRYFWSNGRFTRLGVVVVVALIGASAFVVWVTNIQYDPVPSVLEP